MLSEAVANALAIQNRIVLFANYVDGDFKNLTTWLGWSYSFAILLSIWKERETIEFLEKLHIVKMCFFLRLVNGPGWLLRKRFSNLKLDNILHHWEVCMESRSSKECQLVTPSQWGFEI